MTSGVNEGMRDICLYTLHVYHVYLDGLENYHFITFLVREEGN